MRLLIVFLWLFLLPFLAMANPVIYQGGQMLDFALDSKTMDGQWFYSLTSQTAVGYRYFRSASDPIPVHFAQANFLLNRWNEEDSQANIYLMSGLGIQANSLSEYLGAEADWESRQYYIAAQAEQFWMNTPSSKLVLRAGMAPYVADYDALHTWVIIQATQLNSGSTNATWIMPVLRLFKDNVLAEMGSNGSIHYGTLRFHF